MIELFGQCIKHIYTDDDKEYLVFINNLDNFWTYYAEKDCCSYSWFESINNPENLIDARVIGIEEKDEDYEEENFKEDSDEVIKIYGYTLKTYKGYTDIEFRNSSNGYYGGDCIFMHDAKLEMADSKDNQKLDTLPTLLLKYNGQTIKISPWNQKI